MNRKITTILIVALAAGLGLALSSRLFPPSLPGKAVPALPALEVSKVIDTPRALAPFTLQSANGPLTAENLKGHWTVVFVGFTHCPDVCPTTLTDLAKAQKIWAEAKLPNAPRVLFVSIDPAYFHPDTLSATAAEPQLGTFTRDLGLVYMKVPQGDSYTMDHSATLVLLNPKAEFAGLIRPPLKPDAIARDLLALTKAMP